MQTFEMLVDEKKELVDKFQNLKLNMTNAVDYDSFNEYRLDYEKLQYELQCIETQLSILRTIKHDEFEQQSETLVSTEEDG